MEEDRFLREHVFGPVAERIKDRRDSLLDLARFPRSGIEGWLKVEVARALGARVQKLLNNGPDLQLADNLFVELKGATDCNPLWILGGLKYQTIPRYQRLACLFLGSSPDISACLEQLAFRCRVVAAERFSAGTDEWIVGLIMPKDGSTAEAGLSG